MKKSYRCQECVNYEDYTDERDKLFKESNIPQDSLLWSIPTGDCVLGGCKEGDKFEKVVK